MSIEENEIAGKRRFRRVEFRDPVNYRFREKSNFGGCLAYDISEGGMRINFFDFVPLNTEMNFQVKLSAIPKLVDVKGHVVWLQQVPYSDRYQIGIQFSQSDVFSREEIRSYVKSHQS